MVLEVFLQYDPRKSHPFMTIGVGTLYALLGGILAFLFFQPYMSITMVFITVLACLPFMHRLINKEEKRELSFHTEKQFIKDYLAIIKTLLFLFLGFVIGYLLVFLSLSFVTDTATVSLIEYKSESQIYQETSKLGVEDRTRLFGQHEVNSREEGWWWQSADITVVINAENDIIAQTYVQMYQPDNNKVESLQFVQRDIGEYVYESTTRTKDGFMLTYQKGPQPFAAQLQVLPEVDSEDLFWKFDTILVNNVGIVAICLLFSFLFGAGAIFIIIWNASVFAAAISNFVGNVIASYPPGAATIIAFLKFFSSGFFEIAAYFLAGLAGGIISFGIAHNEVGTKKFLKTLADAFQLVFISLALLILAAAIEVFVAPLF